MRVIQLSIAAVAVALAGACSTPVAHVAGDAAPVTDRTSSAPVVATTTTAAPSTGTSASAVAVTGSAKPVESTSKKTDPCPVKASTLYNAMLASPLNEGRVNPPKLDVQSCYQGYAMARERRDPTVEGEQATFLYKYNAGTGRWKALNLGTGGVCEGYVPAAVQPHLGESC